MREKPTQKPSKERVQRAVARRARIRALAEEAVMLDFVVVETSTGSEAGFATVYARPRGDRGGSTRDRGGNDPAAQ